MIEFPLSKLNQIGLLNCNKISIKKKFHSFFLGFILMYGLLSTTLQYFYMKSDIFDFIENSEGVGGVGQVLIKFGSCIYNKERFTNLIKLSKKFWSTKKCSESLKKEIDGIRQKIITFQKIFFYSTMIFSPAFLTTTLFGKKLPLGGWHMENEGLFFYSVFLAYVLLIPAGIFFSTNFEGLFLGFCFEIKTQFMILSNSLENLSVNHIRSSKDLVEYNQQLRINIRHHIFLIQFVKELQKAYSWAFMVQCFTMVSMICSELYASTESTSVILKCRYGVVCIALLVQFSFYCIPGSFIIDQAAVVSDGIYNSDWFSKSFSQLRMPMMFLIQASQRQLKFTAYSVITINIDTFLKVAKLAFSVNALLKSFKE